MGKQSPPQRRASVLGRSDQYEHTVQSEAEALAATGFDVEVICMRSVGSPRRAVVNGAARMLRDEIPDLRVIITGRGPGAEELVKTIDSYELIFNSLLGNVTTQSSEKPRKESTTAQRERRHEGARQWSHLPPKGKIRP